MDVLVVDDNAFNVYAYKSLFDQVSTQFDTALSGHQAIEFIKEKHQQQGKSYKLIMMDYSMPEMTGPESTKIILKYLENYAP